MRSSDISTDTFAFGWARGRIPSSWRHHCGTVLQGLQLLAEIGFFSRPLLALCATPNAFAFSYIVSGGQAPSTLIVIAVIRTPLLLPIRALQRLL
jgi:hypothetical protein